MEEGGRQVCGEGEFFEYSPPPLVNVQEKLFNISSQVCLDENLLKKLGMTQLVIRERDFLFLSASIAAV